MAFKRVHKRLAAPRHAAIVTTEPPDEDVSMRLLIAMMKHETNTFSPVPTPLSRFGRGHGPLVGDQAIAFYRGTGTATGAYLDLAAQAKAEVVLPIAGEAWPSGPVEDA